MKNSEQSSTPSATPTKRFFKFHNLITFSYDVYHTIEAESYDAAMDLIDQVDCFDDIKNSDPDDFVECYVPPLDWECVEVDEDGKNHRRPWIVEDEKPTTETR